MDAIIDGFGLLVEKTGPTRTKSEVNTLLEQSRKASDLLKVLSHETRLAVLCLLTEGEQSVSALENIMDLPQAAVSQQLARLRFDGLVQTRREGRTIYYSLRDEEIATVISALHKLFCKNSAGQTDQY